MALREIIAKLGYEVDKKSEDRAKASIGSVIKVAAGIAVAFGTAALMGIRSIVEETRILADEMDKTAIQLGISAQSLEEFRFAAGLAGVGAQEMSLALGMLQKNALEASQGSKSMEEDFARLGITVTDSSGKLKSAEQLILEMADGLNALESDTEKVGLSLSLMGRSGKKLLPLFTEGAKGIEAMRQEARELGGVFGKELIKNAVQLTDDMSRLDFMLRGFKASIAAKVMPVVIRLVQWLTEWGREMRGPFRRALDFASRIVNVFGRGLEFMADRLRLVLPLLGIMAALLFPLPALFLLVAAAIFLIIEDLEVMAEGGESAIGKLIDAFKTWAAETIGVTDEAFDSIWKWIKIIGEAFVDSFIDPLELIPDLIEAFIAPLRMVVDLVKRLPGLEFELFAAEEAAAKALEKAAPGAIEAIRAAFLPGLGAATAAPTATGGGTSITSSPTANVQITVQGTANPEATGQAVAEQVEAVLERQHRRAASDITVSAR